MSDLKETILEMAHGLHKLGLISDESLKDYEDAVGLDKPVGDNSVGLKGTFDMDNDNEV